LAIVAAVGTAEMVAPELITVEVLSTLRRLERQAQVMKDRTAEAVADLVTAPLRRLPTLSLVDRMWRLRDNLSAYDACYVALAEALDCSVISGDQRLARAPRLPVEVIVP
jgi:predicted nucleic acid-binding protein